MGRYLGKLFRVTYRCVITARGEHSVTLLVFCATCPAGLRRITTMARSRGIRNGKSRRVVSHSGDFISATKAAGVMIFKVRQGPFAGTR